MMLGSVALPPSPTNPGKAVTCSADPVSHTALARRDPPLELFWSVRLYGPPAVGKLIQFKA